MRLEETLAALREAAEQAYAAMDAACRWAAGETAGVKTTQDADRYMAGYDALLDATVSLGQTLGILSGAALAAAAIRAEAGTLDVERLARAMENEGLDSHWEESDPYPDGAIEVSFNWDSAAQAIAAEYARLAGADRE